MEETTMDINKIGNILNDAKASAQSPRTVQDSVASNEPKYTDKVTIKNNSPGKNEQDFARVEYDKHNRSSFEGLKSYKAKLTEFENLQKTDPTAAKLTEIGQKLNDPDVWKNMAEKILRSE